MDKGDKVVANWSKDDDPHDFYEANVINEEIDGNIEQRFRVELDGNKVQDVVLSKNLFKICEKQDVSIGDFVAFRVSNSWSDKLWFMGLVEKENELNEENYDVKYEQGQV